MIDKTSNPIKNIVLDGGYTAIFRTLAVIGDSLSSGEYESMDENGVKGFHDYYEYSWGQFIARKCGCKVTNYSVGGLTAKEFHLLANHTKCFTKENACQAYIIALGVNDITRIMRGELAFGSLDDIDFDCWENNKGTFVGEYVKILQKIRSLQPKARIFMITIPRSANDEPERVTLGDAMADMIRSLTKVFNFSYVIDLRKFDCVQDEEYKERYYLGGHLSAIGYKHSADVIATYIDWIIRNNIEDFKQVGFIGKEVYNCKEKW